jgi:DNA-binding FrmR family transcriptional regulator
MTASESPPYRLGVLLGLGGNLTEGTAMAAATTRNKHGYSATKDQLRNRLARIEGQVRGIGRMVEDDRYCIDILTQITAIQAALDKVALGLLDDHAAHCIIGGASDAAPQELKDELMAAVARLMRRG